jgi:hypothetical protein
MADLCFNFIKFLTNEINGKDRFFEMLSDFTFDLLKILFIGSFLGGSGFRRIVAHLDMFPLSVTYKS